MTPIAPTRSRKRHASTTLAMTLAAFTAAVLTGCTAPSPPQVPEIVWVTDEPTGLLEDDEWVKAARQYELLSSVAWNAGDYTDPDLAKVTAPQLIQDHGFSREARAGSTEQFLMAGPGPFTPDSVEASTSGDRAVVTGCAVDGWVIDAQNPKPRVKGGVPVHYELKRDDDNNPQVVEVVAMADTCDPTNIPRAVFDPAPEIPKHWPDPDDIRIPEYKP